MFHTYSRLIQTSQVSFQLTYLAMMIVAVKGEIYPLSKDFFYNLVFAALLLSGQEKH